jgi:F-type H+-transporting ATPase subunit alpha
VGDGIARVYGLSNAQYGELVQFGKRIRSYRIELRRRQGVVIFRPSTGIEGSTVKTYATQRF